MESQKVTNRKISQIYVKPVEDEKQEKNEFQSSILPQALATLAATFSAFGMGTVEAYTSPGLPSMEDNGIFGHLTGNIQGNIASLALFAALLSGPPIGFLMDKIGRRTILLLSAIPFITGWALVAASVNLPMLYVGRLLTGFCAGTASLIVPIYVGEIAEDKVRGLFSSCFQLMVTMGNCFVYILGAMVDWQLLAAICAIFPLLGFIFLIWIPSSPRYLLSKGKTIEATASLVWLRGAETSSDVEPELKSIEASLSVSAKDKGSIREVFKMRSIKPMAICLLLLFFQQMTGIEAILMYTVHLFEEAGSNWDPHTCTIIVGSLQVIATFFSTVIVDRAGRRKLLIISQFGSTLSMFSLATFFYLKEIDPTIAERFGWIPLLSLATFIVFFAFGIGPIPFLMLCELNSISMVATVSAIACTVNWGFAYLVTAFMLTVQVALGLHWCFAIFAGTSCVGVFFMFFCVPETKGRSMEEISKYFQKAKIHSIASVSKNVSCA